MTDTLFLHHKAGPAGPFLTESVPARTSRLPWQVAGLSYTASGYGRRIPTSRMVRYNGRWRRVYCCIYSNSGTCYIDGPRDPNTGARGPWITVID